MRIKNQETGKPTRKDVPKTRTDVRRSRVGDGVRLCKAVHCKYRGLGVQRLAKVSPRYLSCPRGREMSGLGTNIERRSTPSDCYDPRTIEGRGHTNILSLPCDLPRSVLLVPDSEGRTSRPFHPGVGIDNTSSCPRTEFPFPVSLRRTPVMK